MRCWRCSSSPHWRSLLNKAVALIGLHCPEEAQLALKTAFRLSGAANSSVDMRVMECDLQFF